TIINTQQADKNIQPPFVEQKHTGLWLYVEPLKETRKLILSFPMPSTDAYYQYKPLSYFAHLLGYEGEGSLLLALRERNWITSL
ncbi:insulinase family protein, partial [Bacillus cereus group sp. Bce031]